MTPESPTAQSGPSDRAIAQAFRQYFRKAESARQYTGIMDLAVEIDATTPPAGARDAVADSEKFADWLAREMPPGTVIGNPYWWAPRIIRALNSLTGKADGPRNGDLIVGDMAYDD